MKKQSSYQKLKELNNKLLRDIRIMVTQAESADAIIIKATYDFQFSGAELGMSGKRNNGELKTGRGILDKSESAKAYEYTSSVLFEKLVSLRNGILVRSTGMHINEFEYHMIYWALHHNPKHSLEELEDYLNMNWKFRVDRTMDDDGSVHYRTAQELKDRGRLINCAMFIESHSSLTLAEATLYINNFDRI